MADDTNIVKINAAFATDIGLKRRLNEDSGLASFPIFAVADGMGGHDSGEIASAIVIEELRTLTNPNNHTPTRTKNVIEALKRAHARVQELSASRPHGAGSTVSGIALVMRKNVPHWLVFNVGDSRVYRSLNDSLAQWTRDHSVIQLWVEQGIITPAEALTSTRSHEITKAVGAPDSKPDFFFAPVVNGERLLICSDGLYTMLPSEAIRASLVMSGTPKTTTESLVERAINAGGHDNITAIVVDVVSGGIPPESDTDSSIVDQSLGAAVKAHSNPEETTTTRVPRTNAVPNFDIIGLEDDDAPILAGTGVPSADSPDEYSDFEDTDPGTASRVTAATSSSSMYYSGTFDDSEDIGVSPATESNFSVSVFDANEDDYSEVHYDVGYDEESDTVLVDEEDETVIVDTNADSDTVLVNTDADADTVLVNTDADSDTVVVGADEDTVLAHRDSEEETMVVNTKDDDDTFIVANLEHSSFSSIEADEEEPSDDEGEIIDFIEPVNLNPAPNAPRDFIYNIDDADTNTGF
ncbi:MAG: protein phosphatase 2C domain-containing protein [Actinomycetaceae bacterium]|nr:protein phosphatase 2C domain-containing protein [Actinomycetaceae bacterium]